MNEASWYKWLVVSTILHFAALAAFSISIGKPHRKIDLSSAYSVNLVGDMGGGAQKGPVGMPKGHEAPVREQKPAPKPAKVAKPEPAKPKPAKPKLERITDKKEVSLSKKKLPVKETQKVEKAEKAPSKDELDALNKKLREIKKRTAQLDIGGGGAKSGGGPGAGRPGSPFPGEGTGRPLDLITQKYLADLIERINTAWGIPGSGGKNLLTVVTIKIRKDGNIVDMDVDQQSNSRIFNESVMRALRAINPLPPLPPVMGDSFEVQLKFRPEGMS